MDAYVQRQFATHAAEAQLRQRVAQLKALQKPLKDLLFESMRRNKDKNVQVAGQGGARHQVKMSRYNIPKQLTRELLDTAKIDWNAAASQSFDDQLNHLVDELKKVTRESRPYVTVGECGKRNKEILPLAGGGGFGDDSLSNDPFCVAARKLANLNQEMKKTNAELRKITQAPEAKALASKAVAEMADGHAKRRVFNVRFGDEVRKFEVTRRTENKRPDLTVKLLKACVAEVLKQQHKQGKFIPSQFNDLLYKMLKEHLKPVKKDRIEFTPAGQRGGKKRKRSSTDFAY